MNLNFWPKMYYSGGGGGGGSGGGGGGAGGGGYGGGAGVGGGGAGGGAAGEQPPEEPIPVGAFRFNTDTSMLEYYDGNQWVDVISDSPRYHTGATRALHMGGIISGRSNQVEFANIETTGNFADFGDLVQTASQGAGMGSRTRAIACGGTPSSPGGTNNIDFATIASTGNALDFGDLTTARRGLVGFSDAHGGLG